MSNSKKGNEPKLTFVQKVMSGETYLVANQSRLELEDEFQGLYFTQADTQRVVLQPPYEPKTLASLIHQNNILAQCVEAMEVNIDGTGYELVPADGFTEDVNQTAEALQAAHDAEKEKKLQADAQLAEQQKAITDAHVAAASAPPPKPAFGGKPNPFQKAFNGDKASGADLQGKPGKPGVSTANPDKPGDKNTPPQAPELAAQPSKPGEKPNLALDQKIKQAPKMVDEQERKRLKAFFDEPFPGTSFTTQRRLARRQLESVGYAFVEMLRNPAEELVGLRNVNTYATRLVKLDQPVQVKKTVQRDGKDVELTMWERERRFCQAVPGTPVHLIYFREYGSTRRLHRTEGRWLGDDEVVAPEDLATELMMFGVIPDVDGPYSIPRWINQLPSVVGSRKAEEENLDFFDAGGLPPAIVFITGGIANPDTADQLRGFLSGKMKSRNRAAVVEIAATSGSIDQAGTSNVKVERFGAEKANDAMFMEYDKVSSEHVRTGFRLPPLFLGLAQDYNFATAYTAYMVAEAQVFQPERTEFDEWINKTIMKELGAKTVKFRSLPVSLKNIEMQLKALELVAEKIDGKGLIEEVNQIAGVSVEYKEQAAPAAAPPGIPPPPGFKPNPFGGPPALSKEKPPENVLAFGKKKNELSPREMAELVTWYLRAEGLSRQKFEMSQRERSDVWEKVEALRGEDERTFYELVAQQTLGDPHAAELITKGPSACNHLHEQRTVDLKPVLDAITKKSERDDPLLKTVANLADIIDNGQKNTNRLLTALAQKEDRPIEVTAHIHPRPPAKKEFTFSDGRKVVLDEKAN